MIKLIALDLDDTLLMEDHTIPQAAIDAILKASEKGIVPVIASGRIFPSANQYAIAIGAHAPVICYNGAQIRRTDGSVILSQAHTPEDIHDMAVFCKERGLYLQLYADDEIVVEKTVHETLVDPDAKVTGIREIGDLTIAQHKPSPKMMIFDTKEKLIKVHKEIEELYPGRFSIATSKDYLLEIMPKNVSKRNALEKLTEILSIQQAEVMVCGDNTNDMDMVEWAGCGVAVGNAVPALKETADYVMENCRSYGVIEAIEKLLG